MLLLIIVMVFITVALLMYSFLMMIEGRETPADRLDAYIRSDVITEKMEEEEKKARRSIIKIIGKQLEKIKPIKALTRKKSVTLIQADIPLTGEELTVIQVSFASLITYFLLTLSKDIFISVAAFIGIWMLPIMYIRFKKNARIKKFNDQLGDALVLFSNSLKAGYSYLQAVSSIAKEMPEPISKEFGRVLKEMSFGMDQSQTLMNMMDRVDSDDLKLMVTAIVIQKETGGNLAEILDNIAGTIRDRVRLQGEVKTLTAQGRFSGVIVALVPFVLGLLIYLSNKPYIMILFDDPRGKIMLAAAFLNEFIGIMIIRKIVKIQV